MSKNPKDVELRARLAPATALRKAIEEATGTSFDCGDHRDGDDEEYDEVMERSEVADERLYEIVAAMYEACKAVVNNWEQGDLATAARMCQRAKDLAEKAERRAGVVV